MMTSTVLVKPAAAVFVGLCVKLLLITSCSAECERGYYGSTFGATVCTACEHGKFSEWSGSTACTLHTQCGAGYFAPTVPATSDVECEQCAPGKYSQGGNDAPCMAHTTCLPGNFIAITGTAIADNECDECSAGQFSDVSSLFACVACEAGTFSPAGASTCTACSPGTYSSTEAAACTPCPGGTFSASVGATAASTCVPCSGSERSGSGASVCGSCAAGNFLVGATGCKEDADCANLHQLCFADGVCRAYDRSFCSDRLSAGGVCGEGDVGCDVDNECAGDMVCADVCTRYHDASRVSASDNCCTMIFGTSDDQSCVRDSDCTDSAHICFADGVCRGYDGSYCTNQLAAGGELCGEGDGDCDGDSECSGDLTCVEDQCALYHPDRMDVLGTTYDCCTSTYRTVDKQACVTDTDCSNSAHLCFSDGVCRVNDYRYCSDVSAAGGFCGEGDVDCDSDNECAGDLQCVEDQCALYHDASRISATDDCCTRLYDTTDGRKCLRDDDCTDAAHICFADGVCRGYDGSYCTDQLAAGGELCGEGDGDCDSDSECAGDLACVEDQCSLYHPSRMNVLGSTYDCCTQRYGTADGKACVVDSDCANSSHLCFSDSVCRLSDAAFCGGQLAAGFGACGGGDGGCSGDNQCASDLVCEAQCGLYHDASLISAVDKCCTAPGRVCMSCPPGTYSAGAASECVSCGPGRFSDTPGASACSDCATFALTSGASSCPEDDPSFSEQGGQSDDDDDDENDALSDGVIAGAAVAVVVGVGAAVAVVVVVLNNKNRNKLLPAPQTTTTTTTTTTAAAAAADPESQGGGDDDTTNNVWDL